MTVKQNPPASVFILKEEVAKKHFRTFQTTSFLIDYFTQF